MQEIFFLLLPVAAFYGWYMGVRSVHQKTQRKENKLSRDYVKGLNFLLSEQRDKAVDHFIALLEVDSETIETHLGKCLPDEAFVGHSGPLPADLRRRHQVAESGDPHQDLPSHVRAHPRGSNRMGWGWGETVVGRWRGRIGREQR